MRVLTQKRAIELGYSADKRKRRRQHRQAAKHVLHEGGILNNFSAPGSAFFAVAQWHRGQARLLCSH